MTEKVGALPDDQFIALWNASESLDEAVGRMRAMVGLPCPRWAVKARAVACREGGAVMKQFPNPAKRAGG
jgi:hypothetical protein